MADNDMEAAATAGVLVIGDEILSGRTKDRNIGTIADRLTEVGVDLKEVRIVGDETAAIVDAVNSLRTRYTYVFTTGGIGPTHDDITVDCIARAIGRNVIEDPRAVALMTTALAARGLELTAARRRMTRMPEGSELLIAPQSGAPGFRVENIFVMAGVPTIMEEMLLGATEALRQNTQITTLTIALWRPESDIADLLAAHQKLFADVAMGSYPAFVNGQYRTELVLRSRNTERLTQAHEALVTQLETRGLMTSQCT